MGFVSPQLPTHLIWFMTDIDWKKYIYDYSKNHVLSEMFPDGDKGVKEVTKRPESAGTHFKNSIISLVDNLATKVILHRT